MNINNVLKIYYSLLFIFLSLLIISYENISSGGSVLWTNYTIFYLTPFFLIPLLINILNSKENRLNNIYLILIILFCVSLILINVVGIYQLPLDLDSVISMQSVNLVLNQGFSTQLINEDLLVGATYSLPILSILGASLSELCGITYIQAAKYLPFIISLLFFFTYYVFSLKVLNKKVALISLLLIVSFPLIISLGGTFNNAVLGEFLFILVMWLIYKHFSDKRITISVILLTLVVIFALSHHLTFIIFIFSLLIFLLSSSLVTFFNLKHKIPIHLKNVLLFSLVFILAYYIFVYIRPFELIINSFSNQLLVEGASVSSPSTWEYKLVLQRLSYIFFIILSLLFSLLLLKKNMRDCLNKNYFWLIALGISLFSFSVLGAFMHFPFNWDRSGIFGWMFFIPGTIAVMLIFFKKNNIYKIVIFSSIFLLLFTNVYFINSNMLDHSDNNEYEGVDYKNWVSIQEWNSALWLAKNTDNYNFTSDETFRRALIVNIPELINNNYVLNSQFKKKYSYLPLSYYVNDTEKYKFKYLIIRDEDFYQIKGAFTGTEGSSYSLPKLGYNSFNKINSSREFNLIYDDKTVNIFMNI